MSRVDVADLVKGGADGEGPKVLVLSACAEREDNVVAWATDEIEEYLGKASVEVAQFFLSDKNIHPCSGCFAGGGRVCGIPCDRNDIASDIFKADDGMLVLHQKIMDADAVVIVTDSRFGGAVNPVVHTLIDRLSPFVNMGLSEGSENPVKGKTCAVLCIGTGTGDSLYPPLMALGFNLIPIVHWGLNERAMPEVARSAFKKSKTFHSNVEQFVAAITNSLKKAE